MAEVDPDDDSIRRFVVQHYRFDPERRQQHRLVPVAAFDNFEEFDAKTNELSADIERRRLAGEHVDAQERVTGTEYAPGHREEAAYGRFLKRAFAHGVDVRRCLAERDAPSNLGFVFLGEDDPAPGEPGTTNG